MKVFQILVKFTLTATVAVEYESYLLLAAVIVSTSLNYYSDDLSLYLSELQHKTKKGT
jgi:hypothetical protein